MDAPIGELGSIVGPDHVVVDEARRLAASRDHAWLSPVLRARLGDLPVADAVVAPATVDELAAVVGACSRARCPVTVRGRGTGNYGQAVPLGAGVVVDTTRLDRVLEVGDGYVVAEAGATFVRLEAAAHETGQELATFPTTTTSTLGGYLCGGAGGVGSIEHGLLWDGTVLAVQVVDGVDAPTPRWVEGDEVLAHVHTYGTTGVLAAARVALAPRRDWTGWWASADDLATAAAIGTELMGLRPAPRLLGADDPEVWAAFPADPAFVPGRVSLRAILERSTVERAGAIAASMGGRVEATHRTDVARLVGLGYNHVTLRAQRRDPSACHVQVGGDVVHRRAADVRAVLPGGRLHLDGYSAGGSIGWGGLLISDFVDEPTLRRGMDELGAMGVRVIDPHTWRLDASPDLVAVARRTDPAGLLNPGKLVPTGPADGTGGH